MTFPTITSENLLTVIGNILREERDLNGRNLSNLAEELEERIKQLDGTALLKSVVVTSIKSNAAELQRVLDDVILRKSKAVNGGALPGDIDQMVYGEPKE